MWFVIQLIANYFVSHSLVKNGTRLSSTSLTLRRPKKHTYQQIKSIRGIMREIIENEIGSCDIKEVIRKPKMDLAKLMDLHGESVASASSGPGEITERPDGHEPPVQTSV